MEASRDAGETEVRSLLGAFLFRGTDVDKRAGVLSGGEKSRLAMAMVLLDPPSVLLMDEPTIHLDMPSVDALVRALENFEGAIGFVSHDVHFIQKIAHRVVRIENGEVRDYPGDWDHYLWRRKQESLPTPETRTSAAQTARAEEPVERSGRSRKEEKRRQAELRNETAAKTKVVRAEIARLEKDIARLEGERGELETRLADPSTYEEGSDHVRESQQRHAEISRDLEVCEELWLERQTHLESLLDE